jgi:hypothetical protein
MTINYNKYADEHYGARFNGEWWLYDGVYITPEGEIFDVESHTKSTHCYGFVIPFFRAYLYPHQYGDDFKYFTKEYILKTLLVEEKELPKKYVYESQEAIKMRLALVRYFINCYKSSLTKIESKEWEDYNSDLSQVIGQFTDNQIHYGRYLLLKEILVQACNYDAIESQLIRTIITSKFNVNETFYDLLLMDYKIFQIPKKVYDEKEGKYIVWTQSDFFISDSEERLGKEIQAIRKQVPRNERYKYFRGNYNYEN